MIAARALRSVIRVCSCNCSRTYFSLGLPPGKIHLGSYSSTVISTTGGGASGTDWIPIVRAPAPMVRAPRVVAIDIGFMRLPPYYST